MDENTRDDEIASDIADAIETANEEHWKDLAREYLDSLGVWTLGAAKTLSLLLEQEYKRGYNAGHDDGFDEGLCK